MEKSSVQATEAELQAYYDGLGAYNVAPLWTVLGDIQAREPASKVTPYVWRWSDVRPLVMRAAELVGTEQAERRVLRLMNPGLGGRTATTQTLFGGIQTVLPGEIAPAHRHTPNALRFIIESDGGYTAVGGERLPMLPGDLVLTPSWEWHDHGNDTDNPMIWLDGLDLPLLNFLEMSFHDQYPEDTQPVTESPGTSLAKYGSVALQPAWEEHGPPGTSPLMYYPWSRTRAALERLATGEGGSPYDGVIMEYTNPRTGGAAMSTMACFVQLLRPGQHTLAHRHTTSAVYHVVEGRGSTRVGDTVLEWQEKDTFCVPGWAFHEHTNASPTEPSFLFSFTDAPIIKGLQLYREEPHPSGHLTG